MTDSAALALARGDAAAIKGASSVSFNTFINGLTFKQFLIAFGTLWLAGGDGEVKYRPWVPWAGQDGRPGQADVAWMLPLVQRFYSPKARQKGMSELWALYAAFTLMREPKSGAKVFGASTSQTREFMELRFERKIEGLYAVYPEIPWPRWEIGRDRAENTENGSYLQVFSSENTGAHGGSQRLALFDEAQNFEQRDFKEMMKGIGPTLRGRNQLAVLGTARAGSEYNGAIENIMKKNPSPRPDVWLSGERSADGTYAHTGMIFLADDLDPEHRVPGWADLELNNTYGGDLVAFRSQHPMSILDMFMSHEGKVIASWDDARHIFDRPVKWEAHHEFYLVYDHGSTEGHPAVCLFIQYDPWLDFVYVFDEVFLRGKELPFTCAAIVRKLVEWRDEWDAGGPQIRAYGDVAGRYGARQIGDIMREETGITFITVHKQDEAAKIELVKLRHFRGQGLDRRGGIGYHSRVVHSVKQLKNLKYKIGKDVPQDLENDAMDAEKYALHEIHNREPTPEPTYEEKHLERIRMWKAQARAGASEVSKVDPATAYLKV